MEEIEVSDSEVKDASCIHISEIKSEVMQTYRLLYSYYILGFDEKNNKFDWKRRAIDCICSHCFTVLHDDLEAQCELFKQSQFQVHACLSCTYFGCYLNTFDDDYTFGCHIKQHSNAMKHPLAMNISGGQVLCLLCDDYMYDRDLIKVATEQKFKAKQIAVPDPYVIGMGMHDKFEPAPELVALLRKYVSFKSGPGVRGLKNTALTCYLNVIVQSLLSAPIFREYLLSYKHKCFSKRNKKICLICNFMNVAQKVFSGRKKAIGLYDLLYAIFTRCPEFKEPIQDAYDFLDMLLKEFHIDEAGKKKSAALNCECLVHRVFQFHYKKKRCVNTSCKFATKPEDDFLWYLYLSRMPEIDKCFMDTLKRTWKQMEFNCSTCQDFSGCMDENGLVNPPIVMTFIIDVDPTETDSEKYFKFDASVDMSRFVVPNWKSENDSKLQYIYNLFAVCQFKGENSQCGHYECYVKKPEGWFKCNDEKIKEISIVEILKIKARIIFYHKAYL